MLDMCCSVLRTLHTKCTITKKKQAAYDESNKFKLNWKRRQNKVTKVSSSELQSTPSCVQHSMIMHESQNIPYFWTVYWNGAVAFDCCSLRFSLFDWILHIHKTWHGFDICIQLCAIHTYMWNEWLLCSNDLLLNKTGIRHTCVNMI